MQQFGVQKFFVESSLLFDRGRLEYSGLPSRRRLEEMKPVVHGLVLPHELPENQRLAKERRKCIKRLRKQVGPLRAQ